MKRSTSKRAKLPISPDEQIREMARAMRKLGAKNYYGDGAPYGGFYDAATPSRFREMGYVPLLDETRMMPWPTRAVIIGYFRRQVRNDVILSAIMLRYALGIGSPTFHTNTSDPAYNREKDDHLNYVFRHIGFANGESLKRINFLISCETLLTGECFAIKTRNGKLQLIPAELVGSPAGLGILPNQPPGEIQGGIYDADGNVTAWRIGKRLTDGTISYDEKDGARIVPAQYVYHLGLPTRVEERRPVPKLIEALPEIVDLADNRRNNSIAWKIQSAYCLAIIRKYNPELIKMIDDSASGASVTDELGSFYNGLVNNYRVQTGLKTVKAGEIIELLEGEDIKSFQPQQMAQNFNDFELGKIERICRVLGMPVEEITSYRRSNYSSSRADKEGWYKAIELDRDEREAFLDDLQVWQSNRAQFFGNLADSPEDEEHLINWTWPAFVPIDEAKTAASQIARLTAGTASYDEIAGENGYNGKDLKESVIDDAIYTVRLIKSKTEPDKYGPTAMKFDEIPVTALELQPYLPNAESTSRAVQNLQQASAGGKQGSGGSGDGSDGEGFSNQ